MRLINRGTIAIVPKKTCYNWGNALAAEVIITEEKVEEHNAYLVNEYAAPIPSSKITTKKHNRWSK